jgi:hypothetical protein
MPHRVFQDDEGRRWEVWDVSPFAVELELDKNAPLVDEYRSQRRPGLSHLPQHLKEGWLAFQTDEESRRLAPIPNGWTKLSDLALLELARAATRVRSRR